MGLPVIVLLGKEAISVLKQIGLTGTLLSPLLSPLAPPPFTFFARVFAPLPAGQLNKPVNREYQAPDYTFVERKDKYEPVPSFGPPYIV